MKLMKRILRACLLTLTLTIGVMTVQWPGVAHAQSTTAKVLVLYDAPPNDAYTKLGFAYAIMLRNLLGHFNTDVTLAPVSSYTAGNVEKYQAAFYLGSYFDNAIPPAFLADIAKTNKTVVWFKYNLWQVAWDTSYGFTTRYGFTFTGLRGLANTPSSSNPAPDFFDTVVYKNMSMVKYYAYNASTGTVSADPDIGLTAVSDATKANVLVTIKDSQTGTQAPYVMRAGNFWYFADLPLSYIGPRDRYLVLCDLLHDILGSNQPVLHRALVRLEDVNALTTTTSMKSLTDYLYSKRIPFSIATIPLYEDPLGAYNGGVSLTVHLAQATGLKQSLNYALARGGKIVMHGYTHQYNSTPNVENAVSGNDYEFWLATQNRPVDEDSVQWASARLTAGLQEFSSSGYKPFAWEAPHYQSSPLAMKAVPPLFKNTYQRAVYYTSDTPNLNSTAPNHDYSVGQFFPYIIKNDYYGQRIIPENLGNIEYNICSVDPYSCLTYTWNDLYTNAQYALVVRDGFASFFFHPFWLEPDLKTPGLQDFKNLVQGIGGLGFAWVSADTVQ